METRTVLHHVFLLLTFFFLFFFVVTFFSFLLVSRPVEYNGQVAVLVDVVIDK